MLQMEIIYYMDKKIHLNGYVTKKSVLEYFEVSETTFKRAKNFLIFRLNAPLEYRRDIPSGYIYTEDKFQLPGLWFSMPEINGLMILNQKYKEAYPELWNENLKLLDMKLKEMILRYGHHNCIKKILAKR